MTARQAAHSSVCLHSACRTTRAEGVTLEQAWGTRQGSGGRAGVASWSFAVSRVVVVTVIGHQLNPYGRCHRSLRQEIQRLWMMHLSSHCFAGFWRGASASQPSSSNFLGVEAVPRLDSPATNIGRLLASSQGAVGVDAQGILYPIIQSSACCNLVRRQGMRHTMCEAW